jgi:hypothetical protein
MSIQGGVLVSRLAFITQRAGPDGVGRVLARLPEGDRKLLLGPLDHAGWYPFATGSRLDAAIAEELGEGDAIFLEMGAQSARDNLTPSQRAFARERDPVALLRGSAATYRAYYSSGRRTWERAADRRVVLRTYESETFSRADCLTVVGWHEQAITMCGGTNVHVTEVKCRARGDDVCEYVCEWE